MKTYLALFIIATCASLALTPIVRRICERFGWLDEPRDVRRVHRKAVPHLGGIAIFASVFIALAVLPFIENTITQSLRAYRSELLITLLPATLMLLLGVYDDLRGASPRFKFLVQGLAGALLYALGGHIDALSVPFIGSVALPTVLSFAVTVFWAIGITNAFNLIDGMDGLASGAALFASLVILVVALMLGHQLVIVLALALSGALVGFLRYNFNPASIFLGDSGTLFIGFLLAALSIQGTQKASTAVAVAIPLMTFGLPVIDTGFTMIRRFISGRPLFEADREHIHHMLLARGWSQRRVALVLYGVCALFGLLALLFISDAGRVTGLVLFIVGVSVVFAVGRLRYHEVDEVRASVKRNLTQRRQGAANNIHVRRASRAMSEAATLADIFAAAQKLLRFGQFIYATVEISCGDDDAHLTHALRRETGASEFRKLEVRDGSVCWSWERDEVKVADIADANRFWLLRLPLSTKRGEWGYLNLYREVESEPLHLDIDYLCNLFRREMAQAVERVLSRSEQKSDERRLTLSIAIGD